MLITESHVLAAAAAPNSSDCATPFTRIETEASSDRRSVVLKEVWLPEGKRFRPLLADMKQPRFYASYRRVRFRERGLAAERRGEKIFAGLVGFGTEFGLWALRQPNGCGGFQLDLSTAVFSQFNLDTPSGDLINTDFIVGPSLTLRRGPLSGRFRLFHQSSHLGDEFLLNNPGVDRIGLSFDAIDLLISVENRMWRLYAGGGYLLHTATDLERGMLKGGLELYALPLFRQTKKVRGFPIFGADFNALEEQKWRTTTSIKGGIEIANLPGTRHFRFLIVYLRGFMPFGQFFNTARIENYGIEFQFVP
ncbi:MAG: DUF1207 domain-containing protein [Nitrospiria bacterium]